MNSMLDYISNKRKCFGKTKAAYLSGWPSSSQGGLTVGQKL